MARGSVFKLPNGRWAFSYPYVDSTGKDRQHRKSFKLRREAEQYSKDFFSSDAFAKLGQGRSFDRIGGGTVTALVCRWRLFYRDRVLATTWRGYEHALREIETVIGTVDLDGMKPIHVQDVIDHAKQRGLAPNTIVRMHTVMNLMFKQAVRWELMTSNPAALVERPDGGCLIEPVVPKSDGLQRIVELTVGTIWEAPSLLAVSLGARRNEVLRLRWCDVDLDTGRVEVLKSKTKSGVRTVTLVTSAREHLRRLKAAQREQLFALGIHQTDETPICLNAKGEPVSLDGFSHAFIRMARQIFPGMRLHDARHAYITSLVDAGLDTAKVQKIAGHADYNFTDRYYVKPDPVWADEGAAALERRAQGL